MSGAIDKIVPSPGYVLVDPLQGEKKTSSGIVLPDSHEERPQKGRVVAVGGVLVTDYGAKISPPCRKGDLVVFKEYSTSKYRPEGSDKDYFFIKFDDVMAVGK